MSISNGVRCNFTSFKVDSTDRFIRNRLADLLNKPDVCFTSSNINYNACDTSFSVTVNGYHATPYAGPKQTLGSLKIKNVIFNDPATIVFWGDGTKTVVKCRNEEFDKEKGLAMAYMKKMLGNKGRYFNEVKKWTRK